MTQLTIPTLEEFLSQHRSQNPGTMLREAVITHVIGVGIGLILLSTTTIRPEHAATQWAAALSLGVALSILLTITSRYGLQPLSWRLIRQWSLTLISGVALSVLALIPASVAGRDPSGLLMLGLLGSILMALIIEEVSGLRFYSSRSLLTRAYDRHVAHLTHINETWQNEPEQGRATQGADTQRSPERDMRD